MSRPKGRPLNRGQHIGTAELLNAVAEYGNRWPAELAHYSLEAVSEAVGREISAGNLYDGGTLSAQGRQTLAALAVESD